MCHPEGSVSTVTYAIWQAVSIRIAIFGQLSKYLPFPRRHARRRQWKEKDAIFITLRDEQYTLIQRQRDTIREIEVFGEHALGPIGVIVIYVAGFPDGVREIYPPFGIVGEVIWATDFLSGTLVHDVISDKRSRSVISADARIAAITNQVVFIGKNHLPIWFMSFRPIHQLAAR